MPVKVDPALIPESPDLKFEQLLWSNEVKSIAGLDEAGRGAWAGPVSAGAVVFPPFQNIPDELEGIRDSKQLTPKERYRLAPVVRQYALTWGIGFASNKEIDAIGILPATRLAMSRALSTLNQSPEHLLLDAIFLLDVELPQTSLYKGDQRSLSIAAASILAKTARDEWMNQLSINEPNYGFSSNKGYGTRFHRNALERFGPCLQHRYTFSPVKYITKK